MTIHKIVGKHTTGDVRNYVGSVGELFYDDATGLIRLADGFTEGGNALKLNEFEDQFVMLTSWMSDPEAATSISTDGVNWTDAFGSTEYVDQGGDYEEVQFYQTAVGGGHIVYLGWDNDVGQNCLFWAETANQAANRSFSPASMMADENNGMDTGCLWLEDVQYINGYFVAVGYQERYETYDGDPNYVKYPFWSYSETGEHWKYGKIDYSYVRTIIDAIDADIGQHTYGIRMESVGGGGNAGMMFTMRFYNWDWAGSPGFFYLQDVDSVMNVTSHSGIPPMLDNTAPFLSNYDSVGFRSVWHDDHGWMVWSNFDGLVYFNESVNPLEGKWRGTSWYNVSEREFGYGGTCIYYAAAGRLKDGNSYLIMTGTDGRYYATADQGRSWSVGLIGPAYYQGIASIDKGTTTKLYFDDNTNWAYDNYYEWTKVKITGSNIPEMNGIFYVYRYNSTEFRLSYDTTGNNWVDSTAWGPIYTVYGATCTFSYTENAMLYLTYGAGTFIAVEDGFPYVWSTTDLTTPWNWDTMNPFDPASGDITGNTPIDFTWYCGNWKGVLAQFQWQGNWAGIGNISFGRIGTQSGLLRSTSRRVSGRINSLNLADNFSVGVVNGVQGGENIGYGKIELRPGLPGGLWMIGAGYGFGPGTSIGSEDDGTGEYSQVAINTMSGDTWSFRSDGIYYNDTLALATP